MTKAINCLTGGDINSSLTTSELAFPEVKELKFISAIILSFFIGLVMGLMGVRGYILVSKLINDPAIKTVMQDIALYHRYDTW